MSYMIFIAKTTSVYGHFLLFIPWMSIQKLPCIILGIVANFLLPRTTLASPMSCVGMQGGVGRFVAVFVSVVIHVLFFVLLSVVLSEKRRLRQLLLYALASLVVILLVEFKSDEVALLTDGCNGGGAAAHTVIQYSVALVGVCLNQIFQ